MSAAPRWPASAAWPSESATTALADRGLIEEAGRSQFGAVLYRTTPQFLKLFGLDSPEALPDIAQWDPSPEEAAALRDRLLRAGEARSGTVVSLRCAAGTRANGPNPRATAGRRCRRTR